MLNATYHQMILIIDEMTAEVDKDNKLDMPALDKLLKNLELIFDSIDTTNHVADVKIAIANLLAAALRKGILPKPIYDQKLNTLNTVYRQTISTQGKISQLEKCISLLLTRNSLAGEEGNLFENFNVQTIASMIALPQRINNYLQSKELLMHIKDYLTQLHYEYLTVIPAAQYNIQNAMDALCDLAVQAGYLATSQLSDCKEVLLSEYESEEAFNIQLAQILGTETSTPDTNSTNFFSE